MACFTRAAVRGDRRIATGPDAFNVFGFTFSFASNSSSAARLVRSLYTDFRVPPSAKRDGSFVGLTHRGKAGWRITIDDTPSEEHRTLRAALTAIEVAICERVVTLPSGQIVLHAAYVETASGAGLILGPSAAGKSTLALALAARGYRVGSDDIVFFDPLARRVRPLPRCFHTDARSRELLQAVHLSPPRSALRHGFITPAHLGCRRVRGAHPNLLLLLDGCGARASIAALTQAESAAALMAHGSWLERPPRQLLAELVALVGTCASYRLTRGSLEQMAALSADVLGPVDNTSAASH